MVNTPAIATVYPTVTSTAVSTPALAPIDVSTYVMKLPAEGSALVNSATVKASSTTATPAARIVNGAAMLGEHHPGIRDSTLVIEDDPQTIQSDPLVILHHEGDLLTAGPGCCNQPLKPCTGDHSSFQPRQNPPTPSVD